MAKQKKKTPSDFQQKIEKLDLLEIIQAAEPEVIPEPTAEERAASKAWRFSPTYDEIVQLLERGTFGELRLVPWGSNYTFIVSLCDPETSNEYAVIYKPLKGEAPLWDFPTGTLYKREYAAYRVSQALGWHIIPPVIVRDGPHGVGTVQLFVDADESINYYEFKDKHAHELKRIVIFDYITNNADRKSAHCMLGADGYLWFIDHGLCFNETPKLRTIVWDYAGQAIPDDILNDLAELLTDEGRMTALKTQLYGLLTRREVDLFIKRAEFIINNPEFPYLTSRRSIPWGL